MGGVDDDVEDEDEEWKRSRNDSTKEGSFPRGDWMDAASDITATREDAESNAVAIRKSLIELRCETTSATVTIEICKFVARINVETHEMELSN